MWGIGIFIYKSLNFYPVNTFIIMLLLSTHSMLSANLRLISFMDHFIIFTRKRWKLTTRLDTTQTLIQQHIYMCTRTKYFCVLLLYLLLLIYKTVKLLSTVTRRHTGLDMVIFSPAFYDLSAGTSLNTRQRTDGRKKAKIIISIGQYKHRCGPTYYIVAP